MKRNADRNAEIVKRHKAGVGPSQIAREFKLSKGAITGVLGRAGKCKPHGNALLPYQERVAIGREWMFGGGVSVQAVAAKYGVAPTTVWAWARLEPIQ